MPIRKREGKVSANYRGKLPEEEREDQRGTTEGKNEVRKEDEEHKEK